MYVYIYIYIHIHIIIIIIIIIMIVIVINHDQHNDTNKAGSDSRPALLPAGAPERPGLKIETRSMVAETERRLEIRRLVFIRAEDRRYQVFFYICYMLEY